MTTVVESRDNSLLVWLSARLVPCEFPFHSRSRQISSGDSDWAT